jgi:hypothetical protein
MVRWNLRMYYNHPSVCRFESCSISSGYNLIFIGQMESRMDYNHPSVCRFGSCSISSVYNLFFNGQMESSHVL